MFTLPQIITRLNDVEGLTASMEREMKPVLQASASLPHVFVGYLGEQPAHELSPFTLQATAGFDGYGEITVEKVVTSLITTMKDVIQHKDLVRQAMAGWNPARNTPAAELDGFSALEGTVIAVNNGRVTYQQTWAITRPTL